jgi:hypothetical protein
MAVARADEGISGIEVDGRLRRRKARFNISVL